MHASIFSCVNNSPNWSLEALTTWLAAGGFGSPVTKISPTKKLARMRNVNSTRPSEVRSASA